MRIASFWARGYRSLRDVRVEGMGAFNVFYGPNGSGKSNILEAIQTLFVLAYVIAGRPHRDHPWGPCDECATRALEAKAVQRRDLCAREPTRVMLLGARLVDDEERPVLSAGPLLLSELTLEVTFDWTVERDPTLAISKLSTDTEDLLADPLKVEPSPAGSMTWERRRELVRALVADVLPVRAYGVVSAARQVFPEEAVSPKGIKDVIAWHIQEGRLKNALLAAQLSPDREIRRKLSAFRALLAGEPLHRPPFDLVQDPRTNEVDLREQLPGPNPEGRDITIDLAGLGVAQLYSILAQAMLLNTRAVGLEEPEAHLHAPTSGRALRQLLVRLVEERHLDQLFIATHSNLFDLDPTGYYDVSLRDGCTVVERADLTRIDREHLYEPGPAKHALARLLQYAPEDEVVFRRPDGAPVTAKEMLRLLQEDDEVAVRFLQDVHGAAVRMVKVQQARKPQAV